MAVALLSLFIGRGPVFFAALMNFIIWNYFFIPPLFTFHVYSIHDLITLFANLIIAIVSGTLITRIRRNQNNLKKSRERIFVLNSLLESLNNAGSIKDVIKKAREELIEHFDSDAVIFLKEKEGKDLAVRVFGNQEIFEENEFELAKRVFETKDIEKSKLNYFPLAAPHGVIGVIGISKSNSGRENDDDIALLRSVVSQITSALDREINIDIVKEKQVYLESQKLFQTVLNSVSHELRTPIAVITTAVSNLKDESTSENKEIRMQICNELNLSATRLNLLVENILDMSKIESGYIKLNLQHTDVSDLIGIVLNELRTETSNHKLNVDIEENLQLIMIDVNWLRQALINIVHNSIIYSPENTEISISAYTENNDSCIIELSDKGPGVPEQTLAHLFEKFYRVQGSKSGGVGLGLAITKAIVEAHNGEIYASNLVEGGFMIRIKLKFS
jgi:two-component system sensor histidine kinase KdpD